jgi:hypothetical protein
MRCVIRHGRHKAGHDDQAECVPGCPVELVGRDAEVAADIDDDGADRAADDAKDAADGGGHGWGGPWRIGVFGGGREVGGGGHERKQNENEGLVSRKFFQIIALASHF